MTTTVTLGKAPTTASDINLDLFQLDQTKLKSLVRTQPNPTTVAYNWNYESTEDIGANLGVYHNVQRSKGSIENTIGLVGSFVATDSVTGLKSIYAPFSGRTVIKTPAGMFVTPAHMQVICNMLFALQFPSVTSGAASTATWGRMLEGNAAFG